MFRRRQSHKGLFLACVVILAGALQPLLPLPAQAQQPAAQPGRAQSEPTKDAELRELRRRVAELEERMARAEQMLAERRSSAQEGQSDVVDPKHRAALQQRARARSRKDAAKYTPEQLAECEQLYQVANKNWRSPDAITSLKQMIEKYPDVNRTGCAVLYLGQMSEGQIREEYLERAVEKHSDCFYLNGVQVGGYARYLLAHHYKETGRPEEAKKLLDEIVKDYSDSITHGGHSLAPIVRKEQEEAAQEAQSGGPGGFYGGTPGGAGAPVAPQQQQ